MPEAMIRLENDPAVPATARNLVDRFGAADTVAGSYDVRLVVSELVTIAVGQTRNGRVQLVIRRTPDVLRVEVGPVTDLVDDEPSPPTGMTLEIVQTLSDRWGIDGPDLGNTIWCEFAVRDGVRPSPRTH